VGANRIGFGWGIPVKSAARGLTLILRPRAVEAAMWRKLVVERVAEFREVIFSYHRNSARVIALGEYRRLPRQGLERSDFEQIAYRGLLEAIDRFDPLRGVPFEAYVRPRIKGLIADALSCSTEAGAMWREARKVQRQRVQSLLVDSEGAEHKNDPMGQLADLVAMLAAGMMIAEPGGDPEAADKNDPYTTLAWRQMQVAVERELATLPTQERLVLEHHYRGGVAFNEIADLLGLGRSRVSQIHRSALSRLRTRLRDHQ